MLPRSGCDCRRYWCQRLLGRVGDVDGHRDGVVRRTVTRLDRHHITRISRLVVIGLALFGPDLTGARYDRELILASVPPRVYSNVLPSSSVAVTAAPILAAVCTVASPTVSARVRVVLLLENCGALLAVLPLPGEDQSLSPSALVARTPVPGRLNSHQVPVMFVLVPETWSCGPLVPVRRLSPLRYCRS